MLLRFQPTLILCLICTALCAGEPDKYVPDPQIEKLIEQTAQRDKAAAQAAVEKLAAAGESATKALNWHLFKESSPAAAVRWAELLARCGQGRIGYKVHLELQPDGSGNLTLSSDRALLADCGKRFARLNGQSEPQFSDDELKHNPYSKAELLKHLNDSCKFQEARVETHGAAVEALGMLSFKNFDAFAGFADSFDDGYNMLAGSTLTDSEGGTRTFQYRTTPEEDRKQFDRNILLFHNVTWEYQLELNGKVTRSNATRTEGNKLFWTFNCYQMLAGKALVQVSYDSAGLAPRPVVKDNALPIPAVASAGQPIAVITHPEIHARVCKKAPEGPRKKEILREQNQLIELDGSGSLPRGAALQYQWSQLSGAELNLTNETLSRPNIPLLIKEAGEYRFELIVSLGANFSKAAQVKVIVEDEEKPAPAVTEISKPQPPPEKAPEPAVTKKPEPAPAVADVPKGPVNLDPAKAKEIFARGESLMKAFKYAEAKDVLSTAYAMNPEDKDCAFELGVALLECKEIVAAASKFEEVVQATKSAKACMYLGHCNARAKNLGEAGRWYKRGTAIGKGAVEWEYLWQVGNSAMAEKDYKYALEQLLNAEKNAAQASVKDYRLPRDLALTYHALDRDDEALVALKALQELGYTPDPKLLEEVKQKAKGGAAPEPVKVAEVAKPAPVPPEPKKVEPKVEPKKEDPKPEPAKVADVAPPVVKPEPAKQPVKVKEPDKNAPAAIVDLAQVDTKKPEPKPEAVKAPEVKKPEPEKVVEVKKPEPAVEPKTDPKPVVVAPPVQPKETKTKKPAVKPAVAKKPPPPVPDEFEAALAAGKHACDEAAKLAGQTSEEAKQKTTELFDEAEAMLQGAWAKKPGDETVMAAFKELSKHVRVIAIPRNPLIKVKSRALTVLDAGLSIVPGTTFYCVWEQVSGEDLGIRSEEMAKKVVALPRSMKPGTYKFELAVSDGNRGGNPVTVVVEVME